MSSLLFSLFFDKLSSIKSRRKSVPHIINKCWSTTHGKIGMKFMYLLLLIGTKTIDILSLKERWDSNLIVFGIVINKIYKLWKMVTFNEFTIEIDTVFITNSFLLEKSTDLKNRLFFLELHTLIRIGCKILIDPYFASIELIYSYHPWWNFTSTKPIINPLIAYQCLFQEIHHFEERNFTHLLQYHQNRLVRNFKLRHLIVSLLEFTICQVRTLTIGNSVLFLHS